MNYASSQLSILTGVVCREMLAADCHDVANLLTKGFAEWRKHSFWVQALERLAQRDVPEGLPQFGYLLETAGRAVGVLLLIGSEMIQGGKRVRRCNVSSWYVEPDFRLYGSMLVAKAIRLRDVVYMNVTPAPPTWNVLSAQGYRQFVEGRTVAIPALSRRSSGAVVRRIDAGLRAGPDLPEDEVTLLREHARWDCISLVCETPQGRVPFVFGRRRARGVPFAYLIYCRGLDSLVEHARPLGWHLARYGIAVVVTDADARLPGMPGMFQTGFPKFVRGSQTPRAGDLAYTERAIFGV